MSLACPVVLQAWFLLRVLDAVLPETPAVGMGAIAHTLPKSLMSALQRQKELNSTQQKPPSKKVGMAETVPSVSQPLSVCFPFPRQHA